MLNKKSIDVCVAINKDGYGQISYYVNFILKKFIIFLNLNHFIYILIWYILLCFNVYTHTYTLLIHTVSVFHSTLYTCTSLLDNKSKEYIYITVNCQGGIDYE